VLILLHLILKRFRLCQIIVICDVQSILFYGIRYYCTFDIRGFYIKDSIFLPSHFSVSWLIETSVENTKRLDSNKSFKEFFIIKSRFSSTKLDPALFRLDKSLSYSFFLKKIAFEREFDILCYQNCDIHHH